MRLREAFGRYPLADARPFLDVDGRELVRVAQEEVGLDRRLQLLVVPNGQLLLTPAAERVRSAVEYEGPVAGVLRPDLRTPGVVMDPRRSVGQPSVRNVRTESLAEDHRAGTGRGEFADLYDLTLQQVDEAIRFELIAGADRAA